MAVALVVDDEVDIRQLVALSLELEGYEVECVPNGADAIEWLASRGTPDVIVLDLMMPLVNGFDVLAALEKMVARDNARVVVLSCCVDEHDFIRAWKLGADDYVAKPFDPSELLQKIEELRGSSRALLAERRDREYHRARILAQLEAVTG